MRRGARGPSLCPEFPRSCERFRPCDTVRGLRRPCSGAVRSTRRTARPARRRPGAGSRRGRGRSGRRRCVGDLLVQPLLRVVRPHLTPHLPGVGGEGEQVLAGVLEVLSDEAARVDVVIDAIGGDYGPRSLTVLRPGGILLSISGTGSDRRVKPDDAAALGLRYTEFGYRPSGADLDRIAELVTSGALRVHIDVPPGRGGRGTPTRRDRPCPGQDSARRALTLVCQSGM